MKFAGVELTLWPSWQIANSIANGSAWMAHSDAVCCFRKLIFDIEIVANTNYKDSPPLLCDAKICRIKHLRFHFVTSVTKHPKLIL